MYFRWIIFISWACLKYHLRRLYLQDTGHARTAAAVTVCIIYIYVQNRGRRATVAIKTKSENRHLTRRCYAIRSFPEPSRESAVRGVVFTLFPLARLNQKTLAVHAYVYSTPVEARSNFHPIPLHHTLCPYSSLVCCAHYPIENKRIIYNYMFAVDEEIRLV